MTDDELDRLGKIIESKSCERLVVLGDLIHTVRVTEALDDKISAFRKQHQIPIYVTRGNHDRGWKRVPESWGLTWLDVLEEDGFSFAHEPSYDSKQFLWAGHLHPTYRLQSQYDSLRLPCFHLGAKKGVLPAFNLFTRGLEMHRKKSERIYVIAQDEILVV